MSCMPSSVLSTLVLAGSHVEYASNSDCSQPAPTPSMALPLDSMSSVVTVFASCAGGRRGIGVTSVPSRMFRVFAAR